VRLLEQMNRDGLTLIVVTHDPAIGGRAPRTIRLVDGALAAQPTRAGSETEGAPA